MQAQEAPAQSPRVRAVANQHPSPETRGCVVVAGQHGARLLAAAFGSVHRSPTEFTATSRMDTCWTAAV